MNISNFQEKILSWYSKHKRDLPWRQTKNPYYILVSEIMLQQTQVERVIPKYNKFIELYPTLEELTKASKEDLLVLWQGLGYNNRVVRLQQAAKQIQENFKGKFPQTREGLEQLSGIGPYTSAAILAFAFNKEVPVVDTNIRRILIHEFNLKHTISDKKLEKFAQTLIPKSKSREYHNALMDYGAIELTSRKTQIKPKTKQSTFVGSTRWVRSQILKQLLKEKELKIKELEKKFSQHNITSILTKMQKNELLVIKYDKIVLN